MQLPTEVKITSHRPFIGKFIVAYKKLIKLIVSPYLRNVFEKEHQFLSDIIREMNERDRRSEVRLDNIENIIAYCFLESETEMGYKGVHLGETRIDE